jgi:hypothetical protein
MTEARQVASKRAGGIGLEPPDHLLDGQRHERSDFADDALHHTVVILPAPAFHSLLRTSERLH